MQQNSVEVVGHQEPAPDPRVSTRTTGNLASEPLVPAKCSECDQWLRLRDCEACPECGQLDVAIVKT